MYDVVCVLCVWMVCWDMRLGQEISVVLDVKCSETYDIKRNVKCTYSVDCGKEHL